MGEELNIDRLKELVKANKNREDESLQRLDLIKEVTDKILQSARFGINAVVIEPLNNSEANYFKQKGFIVEHSGIRRSDAFYRLETSIIIPE
jgi:hypothetical protein